MSPLRYAFLGYCTAEGRYLSFLVSPDTGVNFCDLLINVNRDLFRLPGK